MKKLIVWLDADQKNQLNAHGKVNCGVAYIGNLELEIEIADSPAEVATKQFIVVPNQKTEAGQ
jgi:hypothetical protein